MRITIYIYAHFITLARQWDVALCTCAGACLHLLPRQVYNHFHKILLHNEAQKSISRSLTENPRFNHCSNVSEKVPFLSLLTPLFLLFLLFYESAHLFACSSIPLSQAQMRDTSVREGRERAYGQGKTRAMEEGFGVDERLYGGRIGSGSQVKSSSEMRSQSVNSHCERELKKL